jgi:hypothetical protein
MKERPYHTLREDWYWRLVQRDGEFCQHCQKEPPIVYLEIDHVDGNPNHNPIDGSNYQLLCRSCNRKKNPRGKAKKNAIIIMQARHQDYMQTRNQMSPEMRKSERYQSIFHAWTRQKLTESSANDEGLPFDEIVNRTAFITHGSPITMKRYLTALVNAKEEDGGYAYSVYDETADCVMVFLRTKKHKEISKDLLPKASNNG